MKLGWSSLAAAIVVFAPVARAQGPARQLLDSARMEIDRAVATGDAKLLVSARARIERVVSAAPRDAWAHHYLGYAFYREAIFRSQKDSANPGDALKAARASLERSIALEPIAESHALLSSVLGQMIGSNPLRGMTLGPKSDGQMDAAMRLGKANPRVWLLDGIGILFKPAMFGGGVSKAEAALTRAAELFEQDHPTGIAPTWGRSEVYAWLGQIAAKKKNTAEARKMYAKALAIDPEYGWVKFVLLPALDHSSTDRQ